MEFLHETSCYQTKQSLVYDFQELYRWLVDTTVVSCLESRQFGKKDFYRMDNYVLRLRPEAVRKFIDVLRIKFNSPVRHAGKLYGWDTVIRLKAQELANYVLEKRVDLDFGEPEPVLDRTDSEAIRNHIMSMTAAEARRYDIGKTTLWNLQQRVLTGRPIRIYSKVRKSLRLN